MNMFRKSKQMTYLYHDCALTYTKSSTSGWGGCKLAEAINALVCGTGPCYVLALKKRVPSLSVWGIRDPLMCLLRCCLCLCSWLSALESTKWLQHLSLLLKAALLVVNAVDRDHRPVLVHCSDGWDRTPQIVALSKLLLDPYYRTIEVQMKIQSVTLAFVSLF